MPGLEVVAKRIVSSTFADFLAGQAMITVGDQLWFFGAAATNNSFEHVADLKVDGVAVLDVPGEGEAVSTDLGESASFRLRFATDGSLVDATWWTLPIPAFPVGELFMDAARQDGSLLRCGADGACEAVPSPLPTTGEFRQLVPGGTGDMLWAHRTVPVEPPPPGGTEYETILDWFDASGATLGTQTFGGLEPQPFVWTSLVDASDSVWDVACDGVVRRVDAAGSVVTQEVSPPSGSCVTGGWIESPRHGMVLWATTGLIATLPTSP